MRALYEVAITRLSAPVYHEVICEVCRRVMNEWRGTVGRAYTLKSRSAWLPKSRVNSPSPSARSLQASGWWHSFRPLRLRFRG